MTAVGGRTWLGPHDAFCLHAQLASVPLSPLLAVSMLPLILCVHPCISTWLQVVRLVEYYLNTGNATATAAAARDVSSACPACRLGMQLTCLCAAWLQLRSFAVDVQAILMHSLQPKRL